jgi:hypothetical protein
MLTCRLINKQLRNITMNAENITKSLVSRLTADGMKINQATSNNQDGNLEITIQAKDLGLKSLTIKMQEVEISRPLIEDFDLLGEDEGFVDHVDYSPEFSRELVSVADEEM